METDQGCLLMGLDWAVHTGLWVSTLPLEAERLYEGGKQTAVLGSA